MIKYSDDIEIRSEDVQEILGTPPKWIIRWGTTISFIVILLMVWLSWYFKYPVKIEAPVVITTSTPPTEVVAPSTGYLNSFLVAESDTVIKGAYLGLLQTTTNFEDVLYLETYLNDLNKNSASTFELQAPPKTLVLGETLKATFANFLKAYEAYTLMVQGSKQQLLEKQTRAQIVKIQQNIQLEEKYKNDAISRIASIEKILADKQKAYAANKVGVEEVVDVSQSLEYQRGRIADYQASINNKQLEISLLKNKISDYIIQLREENRSNYNNLVETANQLKITIEEWKRTYVITAQMDGQVTLFNQFSTDRKYVKQGDALMAIVPLDSTWERGKNKIIGVISLPIEGSGRVARGQLVKVKFDSYPAHEFGLVEGTVIQKARLPRNDTYTIEIDFPQGLKTSFGEIINFDQQMTGTASIITEDKRFIQRIFDRFIAMFEQKK
jgi:HlyD family secretion protein